MDEIDGEDLEGFARETELVLGAALEATALVATGLVVVDDERLCREVMDERFAATSDTEARGRVAVSEAVFAPPFVGDATEARAPEAEGAAVGFALTDEDKVERAVGGLDEGARDARLVEAALDAGVAAGLDIVGLAVALLTAEALVDFFKAPVAAGFVVDEDKDALVGGAFEKVPELRT